MQRRHRSVLRSARKHTCRLARTWQHFGTRQVMGTWRERQHVCFCMCDPQNRQDSRGCGGEGRGESDFRLTSGIYLGVQKHEGGGAFTGINPCDPTQRICGRVQRILLGLAVLPNSGQLGSVTHFLPRKTVKPPQKMGSRLVGHQTEKKQSRLACTCFSAGIFDATAHILDTPPPSSWPQRPDVGFWM